MGKKGGKKDSNNKRESRGVDFFPEDDPEDYMSAAFGEDDRLNSKTPTVLEDDLLSRADDTTVIKSSTFDIGEAADMLVEKKANLRDPALSSIVNHLRSSGSSSTQFDDLGGYLEVLVTRIVRMIRRPSSANEGNMCCSILALLALYLGPHDDTMLKAAEKALTQAVDRNDEEFTGLNDFRCNALFAYCFIVYIYEMEEQMTATLDYLQQIMTGETTDSLGEETEHGGVVAYSAEVKATAMDCWVLLASHVHEQDILERAKEGEVFETIATLMDGAFNDLNLKVSAGRAIAFLWETAHNAQPDVSFNDLGHLLCYNPHTVHEVQQAIQKITVDSSKKVSKKNKKEQRAEFRDIESWILHHDYPVEKIRMQGAEIEIASFSRHRVVESLRRVLESGFHSSLRMYPVVKDILEVEFLTEDMDGAGTTFKVQKGSVVDKERTRNKKQDRRIRDASIFDGSGGGYDD